MTATYRLNGLAKNIPPSYDPDIATPTKILLEELNFPNHYNVETGHAVRVDIFSRELSTEDWIPETSKLLYRTGLHITNTDLLYPYLTNTNVWLCNSTTELGVQLTFSSLVDFNTDDYLAIKTALVVKSDYDVPLLYNDPQVFNLTPNTPITVINEGNEKKAFSLHTPTTNQSSVFLRFGQNAGLSPGDYHVELPPGYNNPAFSLNTKQMLSAVSSESTQLVIG
ncbi:MAG: hypothetical protein HGA42_07075 [Nostocales cyanobacterium W4_Combined_metabat2_030]|nr:hypothetical protein [Nostocales cyanobacterium W4_Combined_metabat2_030]